MDACDQFKGSVAPLSADLDLPDRTEIPQDES